MKFSVFILSLLFFCGTSIDSEAQLRNLGKKLKYKAGQRIDRKVDRAADKGLDEVEEGIEEGLSGDEEEPEQDPGTEAAPQTQDGGEVNTSGPNDGEPAAGNGEFRVNTNFDYVPGERLLVFEDFSGDALGDFPARWNTNGTGEVVTFGDSPEKWFLLKSGSDYIPDLPGELPESYTIEFDVRARGLERSTSSSTRLAVVLEEHDHFKYSANHVIVQIPFCQNHYIGFHISNRVDRQGVISNNVQADIRQNALNGMHVSIAVNKTRFRLWINETKYVDVPRLVPPAQAVKYLKFRPTYFKDGKEDVFIRNLKIAEGGLDLRSQLLKEGKVSTNGILFDVNSDKIKPESYGVLRQIALAMEDNNSMRLNIIGHTDSDGDDTSNLSLSQRRAASVKNALTNDFEIDGSRLQTDGKGESQPLAENTSPEGKAANRRVDFISL